jgi:hypothetical protein
MSCLAIEADHPRRFIGDLEGESLHIKRRRALGVFWLNQDIRARTVCLSPLSLVHEALVEGAPRCRIGYSIPKKGQSLFDKGFEPRERLIPLLSDQIQVSL